MRLLAALFVFCFTLAAQVIEGTVVDSVTGAPVAGASIQIAGKTSYSATSGANGTFRIDGVAQGSYTALATKDGFQPPRDSNAHRPFQVTVVDTTRLSLSLVPRARVAGHVTDTGKRPLAGADVRLVSGSGFGQTATTGRDGSFSFEANPGRYFLSVRPPAKLAPPARVGDQDYAWAETWYPGVPQASEAQAILLQPGAQLMDQDVKLLALNAYKIRGRILEMNGDPAPKVAVKLARAGESSHAPERSAHAAEQGTITGKDGSFEFTGVYDGDWRVSAESGDGEATGRAFAAVTITGRDADDLELRLNAPFSVPVQFLVVTQDETTAILSTVGLRPEWGGRPPVTGANKEGMPTLDGLYQGRYLVIPQNVSGYYLASITLGDQDILGRMAEFSPNSPPLKIVYRSDGGTLHGTVEECGSASIVVAPQDPFQQNGDPYSVRFARCSENGQFTIQNLRPGEYYAFAFAATNIDRATFLAALPGLVNGAVTVDVPANQTANVELKVSPGF